MEQVKDKVLQNLKNRFAQSGKVTWVGIRPERKAGVQSVPEVELNTEQGLIGDHFAATYSKKRQVTLIQAEHIDAIASLLGKEEIEPEILRRNIVVSGINLLALKEQQFQIGDAILEMTGLCHPCSRMEQNLGEGGYNAMRGHGGITAQVIQNGLVKVGDEVKVVLKEEII